MNNFLDKKTDAYFKWVASQRDAYSSEQEFRFGKRPEITAEQKEENEKKYKAHLMNQKKKWEAEEKKLNKWQEDHFHEGEWGEVWYG